MTAIGRPLRGAQLVQPIQQPRVADGRSAAAAGPLARDIHSVISV